MTSPQHTNKRHQFQQDKEGDDLCARADCRGLESDPIHRAGYEVIERASVPSGVRFDVPGRYQGQVVEYAFGGFGRVGHDDGAPYRRVRDKSVCGEFRMEGTGVVFYKLKAPE